MLGNVIIIAISWFLLRIRKESLLSLTGSDFMYRILQLVAGFLCTALLAAFINFIFSVAANFTWQPTAGSGVIYILKEAYAALTNVLFEELLFRGLLLYLLIAWWGEKRANLLSAVAFGIYHCFSFEVFGSPVLMMWVLVYSGIWGLMLAYAFSRTGSLALPVGLHLGWRFIDQHVFSWQGVSLFTAATNVHTRYLSALEEMLYMRLPVIAFSVVVVVLLCKYSRVSVRSKSIASSQFK